MRANEIVSILRQRIENGELRPGDKLPTQRDMAWEFQCSLGTVTRAYNDLERRGLTYGEVGRGTYVAASDEQAHRLNPLASFTPDYSWEPGAADLSLNRFFHPETAMAFSKAFTHLGQRTPYPSYNDYIDTKGRIGDLHVAQTWIEELLGVILPLEQLIVTQGAQAGLFLTMQALATPGDVIATEAFGYPGIKAAAHEAGLKIQAVEMDEYGMLPESLDAICKRSNVKLLVTNPTDHNPTGTTLPKSRREQIIQIARRNNVIIVEDGVYAPFQMAKHLSFFELAPDISIYITSFSKVFSPSLRVGYIVAPEALVPMLVSSSKAISWTTSAITLDIVEHLVNSGVISRQKRLLIEEGNSRFTMALGILGQWINPVHHPIPGFLPHLWIRMPGTTTPSEFISIARDNGVGVIGGDRFAMSKTLDDHYVRVCLMALPSFDLLQSALEKLAGILKSLETRSLIS